MTILKHGLMWKIHMVNNFGAVMQDCNGVITVTVETEKLIMGKIPMTSAKDQIKAWFDGRNFHSQ
jgi:hypothetical protein